MRYLLFILLFFNFHCYADKLFTRDSNVAGSLLPLTLKSTSRLFCSCFYVQKLKFDQCYHYATADLPALPIKPKVTVHEDRKIIVASLFFGMMNVESHYVSKKHGCRYIEK